MNINKILILTTLLLGLFSCKNKDVIKNYITIHGKTMGTTYNIKYKGDINYQKDIDLELIRVNSKLSTYIPTSTISKFNQCDTGIVIDKNDLYLNINKAKEIYTLSNGFYDPTVMPLVNYWGFGYKGHNKVEKVDSQRIDSILQYIGFDKINIKNYNQDSVFLKKSDKNIQIDLSSIAKGFGVDKIALFLKSKTINDFIVEIGGEISCSGLSPRGKDWIIGVNTPDENATTNDFIINKTLTNKALATSGNYRNYYSVDGHKYSHTINPKTGFPEKSNLLSATIITDNCMTADALATACMVSGFEWAKNIIQKTDSIDGILIYLNNNKEMKVWEKQ